MLINSNMWLKRHDDASNLVVVEGTQCNACQSKIWETCTSTALGMIHWHGTLAWHVEYVSVQALEVSTWLYIVKV